MRGGEGRRKLEMDISLIASSHIYYMTVTVGRFGRICFQSDYRVLFKYCRALMGAYIGI